MIAALLPTLRQGQINRGSPIIVGSLNVKRLAVSVVSAFAFASAVLAQIPVQWGCDAPGGRTCYFSIQYASGGVRNFTLPSGRRTIVPGVSPGKDRYQVSIDAPNLGDVNRCRQLALMGRSCQAKTVDAGYND